MATKDKLYIEERENLEILKAYRALLRSAKHKMSAADKKNIRLAFELSLEAHKGMRRKSGEPYILHPLSVGRIVSEEIGLGSTSIICALLHDVVEDSEFELEDIRRDFGNNIAEIIDGLTKLKNIFDVSGSIQAENFRKILLTLAKDVRVILIKLADRLHNMRTMDSMPRYKQIRIASETLYLYGPLAHRFGLYEVKSELEDLSMKYTEPKTYKTIAKSLNETKKDRSKYINEFIKPIRAELSKGYGEIEIFGRPKSIFSIWTKMKKQGVSFDQVYDKFAIRIIVDSPREEEKSNCWKIYSSVTDFYTPNPNRLRDWISNPKVNGYEALHCTVMGPNGRWVEVQIRSKRMNEIAEKGYAAHWKYKDDSPQDETNLDEWLKKIRDVLENPDSNTFNFLDDFKLNLFSDEIYTFTPKGEVKVLPQYATALDFAFEIHTDVGLKCIGAKVNHKLVPSSYVLSNGDQIEILTSNKQNPSEEWLDIVVTARAKHRVKQSLNKQRTKIRKEGHKIVLAYYKKRKLQDNSVNLNRVMEFFHLKNANEFYYSIGIGLINIQDLGDLKSYKGLFTTQKSKRKTKQIENKKIESGIKQALFRNAEILIYGDNKSKMDYSLATCCQPIPGDDAFGFMNTQGELEVHKSNCPKAIKIISKYGYKIVKTQWTKEHKIAFLTGIQLTGIDDAGIMHDITNVIYSDLKINMRSISIESVDGMFDGVITLYVDDTDHLDIVINKLKSLKGISEAKRMNEKELGDLIQQ